MKATLIKLVQAALALSIPIGIYTFFTYSQKQADVQIDEYQKMQKEHPNTDKIIIGNYELKEVDDSNEIRWQLTARQGIMEPVSKDVELDKVQISYFDGKKLKMRLSAPSGVANEVTHIVKLDSTDKQRVVAEGEDGKAKLDARKVELNKKNQFIATGGVNIEWPGVAKVTGNEARGSLEKSAELKNFKIVGNTHALIGSI